MATVKIYLEPNETEDQAKEQLTKAFQAQANGDTHNDDFTSPLARQIAATLKAAHVQMLQKMFKEIQAVVGKELIP